MFCSQCGKRVMDTMLFCPFCGASIVIPEQEAQIPRQNEDEAPVREAVSDEPVLEESDTVFSFEEDSEEGFVPLNEEDEEEFVPLNVEEPETKPAPSDVSRQISEILSEQLRDEPVKLQGHAPDLSNVHSPERSSGAPVNTIVPAKQLSNDDMFMDGEEGFDEYDKLEAYDAYDSYDAYEEDGEDDDDDEGFLARHIRGLVALALCAVVAAVFLGWACSNAGQRSLAKAGLAWSVDAYNELAYAAYEDGHYLLAGSYYSQALAREKENYDLANSAAVAFYLANDRVKAEKHALYAAKLNPSRREAYQLLVRLYPDAADRPWEISNLLQKGYQLTGDSTLIDGND